MDHVPEMGGLLQALIYRYMQRYRISLGRLDPPTTLRISCAAQV